MKLHGWEAYFQKRVGAVREKQTAIMERRSVYDAINDVIWQSTNYVVRTARKLIIFHAISYGISGVGVCVSVVCSDCLIEQVAALSFGGYVYFNPDTPLTAEKIFVSLTLLDVIRHSINLIPHAITVITVTVSGQAFISGMGILSKAFGI